MGILITAVIIFSVLITLFNIESIKWLPKAITKLAIGALLLFFVNILSGSMGFYVPINLFTVAIVGFLGFPGIVTVSSIFMFVI